MLPLATFGRKKVMEYPLFIDNFFSWLVIGLFSFNLLIALILFLPLVLRKKEVVGNNGELPPISVIVVARNEFENLRELLPQLLEQNYPEFEVVVINDRSYDGTHDWLFEYEKQHEKLSFVSLDDDQLHLRPGKKFGLTMGIKKAKHEIVALVDADCRPSSNEWLTHIGSQHSDTKKIVLGYSPYEPTKGVLNLFIRFEAFWVAWQYLSLAILGRPYMAVGRNLSYRKQLFFDNKGFANHMHIPYGDDDLLIQEIANAKNTSITVMEPSHVFSKPKTSFNDWFKQKQRHLAASAQYRAFDKFLLSTIWITQVAAIGIFGVWIFSQPFALLIPCLAFVLLLLWTMLALALQLKFKMFKAWYAFALLQLVYQLILLPTFSLMGLLNPPKRKW